MNFDPKADYPNGTLARSHDMYFVKTDKGWRYFQYNWYLGKFKNDPASWGLGIVYPFNYKGETDRVQIVGVIKELS